MIAQTLESSNHFNYRPARLAFDGNENSICHTDPDTTKAHWIKAVFGKRVFITSVEVIGRLDALTSIVDETRDDDTELRVILHQEGGETSTTVFGNTGQFSTQGLRITIECNQLTDELEAYKPLEVASQGQEAMMNIGEIWVYKKVVF